MADGQHGNEISIVLWRDHDERVNTVASEMFLGTRRVHSNTSKWADDIYALGARRVDLPELIDLSGDASPAVTASALALIRDLTASGITVGWRLRLGRDTDGATLTHLYPPQEILDDAQDIARHWQATHYLGKCAYRYGPGFIQVRDRRTGTLLKFTIDDPEHLTAVELLLNGVDQRELPASIFSDYAQERLLTRIGSLALWLPYRICRWPIPSMVV
jgi:hypothetical protein